MSAKRHASLGIHGDHASAPAGVRRLHLLRRVRRAALVGAALLALAALGVAGQRYAAARALADSAARRAVTPVSLVQPKAAAGEDLLRLPGTLQGYAETPIYARTSGYLAAWTKDIGDSVKQGELLARIDTPEVAQQLNEARAAHDQAVAALRLAASSLERWETLRKQDSVSQQELEERRNTFAQTKAAEASTAATVQRLQTQLGYAQVTAPFAGVVTRRNADVGNLVDAGGSSRQLFVLTRTDPLRLYVQVPQGYVRQVKVGDTVPVTLQEWPGREFAGTVARTARALDITTRTLQVEISLPNPRGELLPGAYAQVAFRARAGSAEGALKVPSNTLLFRPEGVRVAVVGDDGAVRLQPVTIRRELAVEVELAAGSLKPSDRLVLNPPDALAEGDMVQGVVPARTASADPASAGPGEARKP